MVLVVPSASEAEAEARAEAEAAAKHIEVVRNQCAASPAADCAEKIKAAQSAADKANAEHEMLN